MQEFKNERLNSVLKTTHSAPVRWGEIRPVRNVRAFDYMIFCCAPRNTSFELWSTADPPQAQFRRTVKLVTPNFSSPEVNLALMCAVCLFPRVTNSFRSTSLVLVPVDNSSWCNRRLMNQEKRICTTNYVSQGKFGWSIWAKVTRLVIRKRWVLRLLLQCNPCILKSLNNPIALQRKGTRERTTSFSVTPSTV